MTNMDDARASLYVMNSEDVGTENKERIQWLDHI